ncbi:MAG: carbohydrate kinase family protein [Clostridia bacterium]|nr:carbohydrate kinase family protein [Clostridia bacterium]
MKKKLLVLGESYMNVQMKTNPPQKDEEVTYGASYSFHPYGAGSMTAISAAKLGANCVFCTKLGDDAYGERLKAYYNACGLTLSTEKLVKNAQTGLGLTLYNDITIGHTYVTKGANLHFTKQDVDHAFAYNPDMFVLPQDDILSQIAGLEAAPPEVPKPSVCEDDDEDTTFIPHCETGERPMAETTMKVAPDGELEDFSETIVFSNDAPTEELKRMQAEESRNLVLYAARLAASRNTDIVVQYNKYTSKLLLGELDGIKILVIDEDMLREASGINPVSIDKTLRALIPLSAKIKAKYYIVQQGNDTSFVYDGQYYEIVKIPPLLKAKARQKYPRMHGTYIGALAMRFLETRDIIDACKYASIASILTESKFGCLDHAPSRAEISKFTSEQ